MDSAHIAGIPGALGRVALGTWSIGGWMWGGSDEHAARATIERALDLGIDLIDTAPVYGFGLSETLVGQVLASHPTGDRVRVATKCGFVWDEKHEPWRDSSPESILREVDESRRRLGRDVLDLVQIHWPDPHTPIRETAEALCGLLSRGTVRAVGVCNYSAAQIAAFAHECPLAVVQAPYNLFQREIEAEVLPQTHASGSSFLAYSPLARGLLAGTMRAGSEPADEARRREMFHGESFERHLGVVARLDAYAREHHDRRVAQLALRWILDGVDDSLVLWGARRPEQLDPYEGVAGWRLDGAGVAEVERIVTEGLDG